MAYGNQVGAISGGQMQAEAVRLPAVESVVGTMRDRIESTGTLVMELEKRLGGVLRMESPHPVNKPEPRPTMACGLAETLAEMETRLLGITQHLRSIVERCEL